jgi:cytidylate kinase
MGRADAPLKPAKDAVQIDTSEMEIAVAVEAAVSLIKAKMAGSA